MKPKFLIISSQGEILNPKDYSKNLESEYDISKVINREVLDIYEENSNERPKYLEIANRFGFKWEKNAGSGFINYNFKANLIKRLIEKYARKLVHEVGFPIYEVNGSNIFDMENPVVDAYAGLFSERLFKIKEKSKEYVMLYDGSYPQFNLAAEANLSYKNLPFGHFSIADCYRYEQSGELMMLFRNRRFYMPDFHPYFKSIDEAFDWYPKIEKKLKESFKSAGRNFYNLVKVSSEKNWEKYREQIIEIAKRNERDIIIEVRRDGVDRYWIIDVDYGIVDELGQPREIGCIQIDVGNAKRLGIEYKNEKNKSLNPVIIHSAIPGGIERYIYMCLDQFPKFFPEWLYPVQVRLIPISDDYKKFCFDLADKFKAKVRIEVDDNAEPVGKRIKRSKEDLVPFEFVIGEKEVNRAGNWKNLIKKLKYLEKLNKEFVYADLSWPSELSKQI